MMSKVQPSAVYWTNEVKMDHVSYGGPRPMYRPIYRSIHRSILDGVLFDTRSYKSIYRPSIDRCIDRYSYRSIYTWWLSETSLILDRYFTDTAPMLHRHVTFTECIGWYRSIYRLIHWSTLDQAINALVSVDVSADILVYTSVDAWVDSIKYQAIYRWIVSSITYSIGR